MRHVFNTNSRYISTLSLTTQQLLLSCLVVKHVLKKMRENLERESLGGERDFWELREQNWRSTG